MSPVRLAPRNELVLSVIPGPHEFESREKEEKTDFLGPRLTEKLSQLATQTAVS
jgi:hypothetical protein